MSTDPMADSPKNIGTSPYAYVWNNPLKFVDPTGMEGESVDTDYTIIGGKIEMVKGTQTLTGSDRLIRGRAKYNRKGQLRRSKNFIYVDKGILNKITTDGINKKSQTFNMKSGKKAENLYNFIAGSTNNEYGKYDVIEGNGDKTSIFHATFNWNKIKDNTQYLRNLKAADPKLELRSMIHSHGNDPYSSTTGYVGSLNPSGGTKGASLGDVPQKKFLLTRIFNKQKVVPTFTIWRYGSTKNYYL